MALEMFPGERGGVKRGRRGMSWQREGWREERKERNSSRGTRQRKESLRGEALGKARAVEVQGRFGEFDTAMMLTPLQQEGLRRRWGCPAAGFHAS